MNEKAREKLSDAVLRYGRGIINDAARAESVLQTELKDTPRERDILLDALRADIPSELLKTDPAPMDSRLERLTQKLSEARFLQTEAARWSVETWAVALGMLTPVQCELYRTESKRTSGAVSGPSKMPQKPVIDVNPDPSSTMNSQVPLLLSHQGDWAAKRTAAPDFDYFSSAPLNTPSVIPPVPPPVPSVPSQTPPPVPQMPPSALPSKPMPRSGVSVGIMAWSLLAVGVLAGMYFFSHRSPPALPVNSKPSATPSLISPNRTPSASPEVSRAPTTGETARKEPDTPPTKTLEISPSTSYTPKSSPHPPISLENSMSGGNNVKKDDGNSAFNKWRRISPPVSEVHGDATPPFIPWLVESDLAGKSSRELTLLRNEPYARHGYRFHDASLLAHFKQMSWYHPTSYNADQAWSRMGAAERHNTELIRDYQKRHGMIIETETSSKLGSSFDLLVQQVSERDLNASDLSGKSSWELKLLRNLPFARHGYRFHDAALLAYFQGKAWYHPDSGNQGTVESRLTRLEQRNAERIRQYQKQHGL